MGIKRQSPGKWQVFSETGVGAGYKLHTYTPGTTDNKLTHTNAAGSADNTNPVIFDARGEADIWFNGTYDLKLVDENDTLIWTLSDFGAGEDSVNYGNFNLISDGGFEDDTNGDNLPDQWTITEYPTAGSGAGVAIIDTTDQIEGAQSLKFTSVGDGGGYAESAFFDVREGDTIAVDWMVKSSAAGVRNVLEIIWYTAAQVSISTSSIFDDSAANPTTWTQKTASATAVSTARFAKLRLTGCHSSDATSGSTWFDDVKAAANVVFGDASVSGTLTQKLGSDVASAAALSLGDGNFFDITGTTTISSIDSKGVGTQVTLRFDGVLTLTHNGADLPLPGDDDITTAAGDIAVFYEYASGDWRCISYTRADTAPILYEEGTWTPTLQDASFSDGEGQTYSTQLGRYTRIGREIFIEFEMRLSSLGTLSGNVYLAGLPFSAHSAFFSVASANDVRVASFSSAVTGVVQALINDGDDWATLQYLSAGSGVNITTTHVTSNGQILGSLHYSV